MLNDDKKKLERMLLHALSPWVREISANYRLGDNQINQSEVLDLNIILRKFYDKASKHLLRYDMRQYKSSEIDPFEQMRSDAATQISKTMYQHNLASTQEITATTNKWIQRVSNLAITNNLTINEARQMVLTHMRAHSLMIATTESQFVTEATRQAAILLVTDPLKNSVIQVANLIEAGDTNAAVRLSNSVMRLVRQPLSISQGNLVRVVQENMTIRGARTLLMTPLTQGRIVADLREMATALDKPMKEWSSVFIETSRETHMDADGQQVPIDEPFVVDGEELMYPGDASMGASIGNVANCLCAVIFV